MMLMKRRKSVPLSRLIAFIKRLSTVSLQLDPKACGLVQHMLRKLISVNEKIKEKLKFSCYLNLIILLFKLNKSTDLLFDIEYQFNGIYKPELPEPDYANAQNSVLWELHLLSVNSSK